MRTNTYDASSTVLRVDPARGRAFEANAAYYADVFTKGRKEYAIPAATLTDPVKLRQLAAFFSWSAWAASTNRPADTISYTSNWPHEPLVGNTPTGEAVVWTGVSIILLLSGIGAMVFYHASRPQEGAPGAVPASDPLLGSTPTPSQRATVKYFWTVAALFLLQIAHAGHEAKGLGERADPPQRHDVQIDAQGQLRCRPDVGQVDHGETTGTRRAQFVLTDHTSQQYGSRYSQPATSPGLVNHWRQSHRHPSSFLLSQTGRLRL